MGKYSPVELEDLRARLREAEETLAAIRKSEVDSLVVTGPNGEQVFSLKGAEHPYRVFVEQMLEGALILSGDGTVLYCNRRFAQMVHAPLEKVIGSQFKSFALAADRPELEEILRGPCGTKVHLVLRAADGASVSTQLALSRLPNDPLEAICVVVTDLAEQQQKQDLVAALQKLRLAQEQLQLQNDALVRARLDAEAASDAKDNFLAALSHELRTPLTPVVMAAASLEADLSLPDSVRQELAILRRNVELEARLIDDLLDLTRIVQGKIELRSERVDAHAILGDALSLCRNNMSGKRLELVRALGASRFHVIGDPVRIEQILWNLLRNAVKFTPEGGGIMVRSYNQDQSICISVNDTGIGIEAGAINRIFRPFEQADREITRQFGGLGLGLAISKKLAELQGGAIIAQSDG
jgi:signal transduction histidine kinase